MTTQTQKIVRVEGMANSYGIGEEVAPNCVLFKAGDYHLTWDQLQSKLKALPKGTVLR
jgi:hypothetical protein